MNAPDFHVHSAFSIYDGLGKELPCVNRFLAQTGSSHPDTGVLEDFAGGSFNVCSKLIVDKVAPSGDQTAFPFAVSGPNESRATDPL